MNKKRFEPDKIWPAVLEKIADGAALKSAIRDTGMSYATAKVHLRQDPVLRADYEQAVRDRADRLAEGLLELVDAPVPDDLDPASRTAYVNKLRLQIDVRKFIASRTFRQAWGERLDVDVTRTNISITAALHAAEQRLLTVDEEPLRVEG
jgi:hypothetical protein